jgi:prepilin-type N-terminal cleavage/methylation domain-containing protein
VKSAGFSLIEVLVATAIVAVGVASLAQLILLSARANRIASTTSVTLLLAEQKMEELISNAANPSNHDHIEYLGSNGAALGVETMPTPPSGTSYICRWSITALDDGPGQAIAIQVLVAPWPDAPGQTRLVSLKTRRAS